jgi:hypothetical protein
VGLLFFRQALVVTPSAPLGLSAYMCGLARYCLIAEMSTELARLSGQVLTTVLDFLQTRNGDRKGGLPDREFRRSKGLRRADIETLITLFFIPALYP